VPTTSGYLGSRLTRSRAIPLVCGVLLLAGCLLRLVALDRYPAPVYQDELSNIYDGYSLLETGADRWGSPHPVVLRAFGEGDYRPGMFAWLSTIPIAVGGFSVTSGLIVSAVLGSVALVLIALLALRLAGPEFAVAALAIAAQSPRLISFSRVAHEGATLAPFLFLLVFFLWQRASSRHFPDALLLATAFTLGLSTNSYQTARLTAPLLALCIAWDIVRESRKPWRALILGVIGAAVGATPQIWVFFTDRAHFVSRAGHTLIQGDAPVDVLTKFVAGIGANLGPKYLFSPNMRETFLTSARLLPIEALFCTIGILTLWRLPVKETPRFRIFLYLGLLISLLPAAVTNQNPHSLRAGAFSVLAPFFSAAGAIACRDWLLSRGLSRRALHTTFAITLIASFAFVAYMYLGSPNPRLQRMQFGLVQATRKLPQYQRDHPRIFVELRDIQPYMYVTAFSGMTPLQFQKSQKEILEKDTWDVVRRVGKYFFRTSAELHGQSCGPRSEPASDLVLTHEPLANITPIDSAGPASERYYFSEVESRCYR
jgi:4-amino-4-deoxy-L-arabinose transferase-like glycosyltransferase